MSRNADGLTENDYREAVLARKRALYAGFVNSNVPMNTDMEEWLEGRQAAEADSLRERYSQHETDDSKRKLAVCIPQVRSATNLKP